MKFILTAFILMLSCLYPKDMSILYMQNGCNSCHGVYGEGMGATPKLQGLSKEYLVKRFKELRQGITKTPNGAIMVSFAKALNEQETNAMAEYLSNLKTLKPKNRYELHYDSNAGDGSS